MNKANVVELKQIRKYFGTVKANDGVDLFIHAGEIHAILGENGSGKSTLMNILSGLYAPDGGQILLDGQVVSISSPRDAMDKGIGMIHQHFMLVEALTAWENIVGGMKNTFFLNKKKIIAEILQLCDKYKLHIDPEKKLYDMTIGEKQTVEIMKALYRGARIMILDEPTAVLTTQEAERLFEILREMKANGCAVIIITHKLQEVMSVSDRVTVLRKGMSVGAIDTADATPTLLAELMVGKSMDISVPYLDTADKEKKPVVCIRDLVMQGSDGKEKLHVDELTVYSYEILGIAGVADSGQKELCEAITGVQKSSGSVILDGTQINGMNPCSMLKNQIQIGFVPEDRLGMGLIEGMSISDNVALRSYQSEKGLFLNKKEEVQAAKKLVDDYGVSTAGVGEAIQNLSGGNIQKVLLGREINRNAKFLIAAYPVRGLDIGASNFIYEKLNEEKIKGVAIMFVGEDLDVMLGLCDRIAVLNNGKLMSIVDAKTATKEQLGLLMMGQEVAADV